MKEIETLFGLMRQLIDEVRTLRRAPGNSGPTEIDANRPLSREKPPTISAFTRTRFTAGQSRRAALPIHG